MFKNFLRSLFLVALASVLGYNTASTSQAQYHGPTSPPFTIYGSPAVAQGAGVRDRVGVTATGFLYQYDPTVTSLEEGQYRIGTNTSSGYTDKNLPAGLGSHVIKVWFTSDDLIAQSYPNNGAASATYPNMPIAGNPNSVWGTVGTLAQLAQSPPMVELFKNPDFDTYILEAYEFDSDCHDVWKAPTTKWTSTNQSCVYTEFYNLAQYLLQTYSGTGKTFVLQNWEGDNALNAADFSPAPSPTEQCNEAPPLSNFCQSVVNMRQWLNLRWQAVNDARNPANTTYNNVTVAAAAEVNIIDGFPTGGYFSSGTTRVPTAMDLVVPYLHMDLYSCSCYYTDSNLANDPNLIDNISSPPPPRPQILYDEIQTYEQKIQQPQSNSSTGGPADSGTPLYGTGAANSVYIGEFNTPESHEYTHDQWTNATMQYAQENTGQEIQGALVAGAKWIVYWQVYSNDLETYTSSPYNSIDGYWLIRPPCNATDSSQQWCSAPPSGYTQLTNSWNYLQNVMPIYVGSPTSQNEYPYQYVYEAEEYYTGIAGPSAPGTTLTEVALQDSSMTGDYGTELENAAVGSSITYSMYVPTTGNQTLSVRYKGGPSHGIFEVFKNGSLIMNGSNPVTCDTYSSSNTYTNCDILTKNMTTGLLTITLQVTGQNSASSGYNLVIDNISFQPPHP